jgi:hypothetical protein
VRRSAVLLAILCVGAAERVHAQVRIEGLVAQRPPEMLVFTVRGEGLRTPLVAFQERARSVVESHMNVRVISMDETLARGGAAFQKRLADCRGDPPCLSALVGKVDAKYLLVITATMLGEVRLVGSRLIDLGTLTVLGEAVDEVPTDQTILDVLADRVERSVPQDMWDPFGTLQVAVNEPGAQIRINGRIVGMSPLAPLGYLIPGEYKVEALKDGFRPAMQAATVQRGGQSRTDLALDRIDTPGESNWWLWAGIGLLVAAGAGTAAALALSSRGEDPIFCSAPDAASCP